MKIPQYNSNKNQKIILWTAIILSLIIYGLALYTTDFKTTYGIIECPENNNIACENLLYYCENPSITGYTCTKKENKICEDFPELCKTQYLSPGEVIGEPLPEAFRIAKLTIATLLILATIGYFLAKEKEVKN